MNCRSFLLKSIFSLGFHLSLSAHAISVHTLPATTSTFNDALHLQETTQQQTCLPRALEQNGTGSFTSCQVSGTSFVGELLPSGALQEQAFHPVDFQNDRTVIHAITLNRQWGGTVIDEFGTPNAFVYDADQNWLTTLRSSSDSMILGANDTGTIYVGSSQNAPSYWRVSNDRNVLFQAISLIPNGDSFFQGGGYATDANRDESVVGSSSSIRAPGWHAFVRFRGGQIWDIQRDARDLPALRPGTFYESSASAINDSGIVVGYTYLTAAIDEYSAYGQIKPRAFYWVPSARGAQSPLYHEEPESLGRFYSFAQPHSKALAINNQCTNGVGALIVGYYFSERSDSIELSLLPSEVRFRTNPDSGEPFVIYRESGVPARMRAFVFDVQRSRFYEMDSLLRDPAWRLSVATSIDDLGKVVGIGFYNGQKTGFVAEGLCEAIAGERARGRARLRALSDATVQRLLIVPDLIIR